MNLSEGQDNSKIRAPSRAFSFEKRFSGYNELDFEYSGKSNANILHRLIRDDLDRQKSLDIGGGLYSAVKQKLNKKPSPLSILQDLRNPLTRI